MRDRERIRTFAPGLGVVVFAFALWTLTRPGALFRPAWLFVGLCIAALLAAGPGRLRWRTRLVMAAVSCVLVALILWR
jgi:hypothetical protein